MNTDKALSLGFSPCPNDCFIFDAMIHGKIDTEGLRFHVEMDDVETLNRKAFDTSLDITKLSYHAYLHLSKHYQLLNAGSALGKNCGPLLIARPGTRLSAESSVVIPGKYTTANFLLSIAFPEIRNKTELVFSEIEDAVLEGKADAGLIIHENRFTYESKGLQKLSDLGEHWERTTGAAIPLGGIVIRRDLPLELKRKVDRVIRRSVMYAFEHPQASLEFVRGNAQEMNEDVMYRHIELYVNDHSVDLGPEGKKAVQLFFEKALELKLIAGTAEEIFLM